VLANDVPALRNKAPPYALIGFDLRQMEGDVSVSFSKNRIPSPIKIGRIE